MKRNLCEALRTCSIGGHALPRRIMTRHRLVAAVLPATQNTVAWRRGCGDDERWGATKQPLNHMGGLNQGWSQRGSRRLVGSCAPTRQFCKLSRLGFYFKKLQRSMR